MKTVVTGATGFLGRPLCRELVRLGHQVTALSRDAGRARAALPAEAACLTWNQTGDPAWKEAVACADAVIHLAGESVAARAWTPEVKQRLMASRVDTTRALVDAMRGGPQRPAAFLCASGINYYGDGGEQVLTEESPRGDTFLADVTGAWEAEAIKAEALGIRVTRHRIGVVLGKEGGPLEKMMYPLPVHISPWKLGLGGPIGSGRQWFPWIHQEDAVGIFAWTATNPRVQGAVNTVAPQQIRNREFTRALARALHRPAFLPIPGFALRTLIGEFADELLTGQRAIPAVLQETGYPYRYPDIDSALRSIFPE